MVQSLLRIGAAVRRLQFFVWVVLLIIPLFLFSTREAKADPDLAPLAPHKVNVLVVSPDNIYEKGAGYLISDLARYGFNVTQCTSDKATAIDYLNDSRTSNLEQYQVVILQGGSVGFPPVPVSLDEFNHFVNYGGILIVIGNALFRNESSDNWWDDPDPFTTAQIKKLDQRLGVNFTGFFGNVEGAPYWDNNGTFTRVNNSIKGLPSGLSYTATPSSFFQLALTASAGNRIYDFISTGGAGGKTVAGVTFYKNATGAVGIYIQGSYVRAQESGTNQIRYYGFTDISSRASMLASLIAYSLGNDIETIIKPQPLATIGLKNLGGYGLTSGLQQDDSYLNTSLSYFNSLIDAYNITPTITFTDCPEFKADYWQTAAPKVLSQLSGEYGTWEYTSSLRNINVSAMTATQIQALIASIEGNYSAMGINLFNTIIAPRGLLNQALLSAMVTGNLTLVDIPDYSQQGNWNLKVNSTVLVHKSYEMAAEAVENFTEIGIDNLNFQYFSSRDKWAFSILSGFPEFVYDVRNFRQDQVGTYSLRTVCENLTSEVPDVKFVPLMEAGLYFGNHLMRIKNAARSGSVIEFDLDASSIPSVVGIEKGMLWLRIDANESIQGVQINDKQWFYYNNYSIRLPAPMSPVHVKVNLGNSPSPRLDESRYEVVEARYDGYRFDVLVSTAQGLNVTVQLYVPKVGLFQNTTWTLFSPQAQWNYDFDTESRMLKFWAISEGSVTLEVGVFWTIQQTRPWYNASTTFDFNITGMQANIQQVTLSYGFNDTWFNVSMILEGGLWTGTIPAMPYNTVVEYRVVVLDVFGHRLESDISTYNVIDETPPDIGVPSWTPLSPDAEQPVTVNVSVTEPKNASGVQKAVLWYFLGSDIFSAARAKSINMTNENGAIWSGVIPSQSGGVVSFFISAQDQAGNVKKTATYNYRVSSVSGLPFQVVLLGVGIVCVTTVIIFVYFAGFRRNKKRTPNAKIAKRAQRPSRPRRRTS